MMDTSGKSPCRINRHIRIISIHIHAKVCRCIGNQNSDCSKTDHSKFLSFQLTACKCFLRLFCVFGNIAVFFIFLYPANTANDISGCEQHACQHQFFNSVCVCTRCIKYNNTFFCASLQWNVIHAGSGSCHCFQIFWKFHLMHNSASDQNRICFFRLVYRCIFFCQLIQPHLRDWIQAMIFIHTTDSPLQISS